MPIKDGLTWADYVRRVFLPSLDFYRRVVMERFLPSLSDEAIRLSSRISSGRIPSRRSIPPIRTSMRVHSGTRSLATAGSRRSRVRRFSFRA
jgi:hypothetical protein